MATDGEEKRDLGEEFRHADLATLEQRLQAEDPDDRARALKYLAMMFADSPDLVERILPLLADADELVRYHAVDVLGKLGPRAAPAAGPLGGFLDSGPYYLRLTAHRALKNIVPAETGPKPELTGSGPYPCPFSWLLHKYRDKIRNPIFHYEVAFPTLQPLVVRFLHTDWRRTVFSTEDGRTLNLMGMRWVESFGTRPFDAPLLFRRTAVVGRCEVTTYLQPHCSEPSYPAAREFLKHWRDQGWYIENDYSGDEPPQNLGIDPATGTVVLTNYYAAQRVD